MPTSFIQQVADVKNGSCLMQEFYKQTCRWLYHCKSLRTGLRHSPSERSGERPRHKISARRFQWVSRQDPERK